MHQTCFRFCRRIGSLAAFALAPLGLFATNHDLGTFGGTRTISGTITASDNISTFGLYLGGTGTYINPQTLGAASTSYAHVYSFTAAASGTAYISSFRTSHPTGDGSVSLTAYANRTTEWYNPGTGAMPVTAGATYSIKVSSVRPWSQTFSFTLRAPGTSSGTGTGVSSGSSGSSSTSSSSGGTGGYVADRARTWTGAAYRDGYLAGSVTLKLGKANRQGTYKVSGSLVTLDGKKHTIAAASATQGGGTATVGGMAVKGLGTLTLKIGTGSFSGTMSNGWTLKTANISSLPAKTMTFRFTVRPNRINDVDVLKEYLPVTLAVSCDGKKLTPPKAGKVVNRRGTIQVSAGGEGNPSGLKLSFTPRTGQIKGSFGVYTFDGKKLKKYSARVSGVAANNVARMVVTIGRIRFSKDLAATLR